MSGERIKTVTQSHILGFAHRYNPDGTIDSICRECYTTVGTAASTVELEILERNHNCNPWLVERYLKPKV
jgi:hypothetical protein